MASFLHHVFVVSSEGQYLLKLIENTHKLIPYSMLRQVFKLGNAATMLNAMVKLLLAKLSLTSLSNWVGLTQNADEGMNLLQRYTRTFYTCLYMSPNHLQMPRPLLTGP